jgi:type I restriction enzyme, S subunit
MSQPGKPSTPSHWQTVRLCEIADVRLGRQRSPDRATGPHMRPYLRAANVTWSGLSLDDVKEMDFTPTEQLTYCLKPGDILLSEASGSPSEVGKAAVYRGERAPCFFQNTLIRVRPPESLVRFLHLHFVKDAVTGAFATASRGVGIHHLGAQTLERWEVAIPPPGEQTRIVDSVDSHLSRLDAAAASLEAVQRKLNAYRASVLKAAVEGRLVSTEADLAQKEGRAYEPADVLLQRILKERRRRWEEAELARMSATGKTPNDDRWKANYKEPPAPEVVGLSPLPEGWCWATTAQLFSFVTSGSRGWAQYYSESGPVFIRIGNLDHDSISLDLSDVQRVSPPSGAEGTRTRVVPGDVLVSITADVGMIAVVPAEIGEAYINQHISLARPVGGMDIGYLAWFLAAAHGGQRQFSALQRGATKAGLGLDDIRSVVVPIPPLAEQGRIVDQVERCLSVATECHAGATANQRRIRRLRQAVLRWAFEARLVDQDPTDEPVDALLDRIRAERASALVTTPKAKRSRKLKVAS